MGQMTFDFETEDSKPEKTQVKEPKVEKKPKKKELEKEITRKKNLKET